MKIISTKEAPPAIGPYSQAMVSGNLVFLSGQLGINPLTGRLAPGGIKNQTRQIFQNIDTLLRAAGSSPERVIKTTCYLADLDDFAAFNTLYAEFFTSLPARSCVEVAALPLMAFVEVEVIAELDT